MALDSALTDLIQTAFTQHGGDGDAGPVVLRPKAGDRRARRYNGGKGSDGVYQTIINQMPPHRVYIEAFLGNGSILRHKRPAAYNYGIEKDEKVLRELWTGDEVPNFWLLNADAIEFLTTFDFEQHFEPSEILVYLDPPYLISTRKSGARLYRHELTTEPEHRRFLAAAKSLKFNVMISAYASELYDAELAGWRRLQFAGMSSAGPTVETLYMNFPEPVELHDYKFLGSNFREREQIKRQKTRWINRLANMPPAKRYAMLAAIEEFKNGIV